MRFKIEIENFRNFNSFAGTFPMFILHNVKNKIDKCDSKLSCIEILDQIFIEIYGLKDFFHSKQQRSRQDTFKRLIRPRIYSQTAFLNLSWRKFSSTYESYQAERKYDKVSNSIQENISLFLPPQVKLAHDNRKGPPCIFIKTFRITRKLIEWNLAYLYSNIKKIKYAKIHFSSLSS